MGLINEKVCYTYEDLTIKPCVVSNINHRIECNPYDEKDMLPLFTAPMDTVVDEDNVNLFEMNKINAILPRIEQYPIDVRVKYATGGKWAAFSLDEFIHYFCTPVIPMFKGYPMRALIDVANGHMQRLFDAAKKAKSIWGNNLILMGGNIANEETYELYAESGFDYVRIGIGGGCFVGNTNITLSDNTKKYIKDVQVGDKVKTINGNYDVVGKKEEKTNTLVKINDSVTCTPNHKFLVINKDDIEKVNENNIGEYSYYVEAKKLDKNKQLLVKML